MKNKYHTLVLFLVFPLLTSVAAAQQKNTGINISAKEKIRRFFFRFSYKANQNGIIVAFYTRNINKYIFNPKYTTIFAANKKTIKQ